MKSILQLITARWHPRIEYVGPSGRGQCYHVTLPCTATEDDVYAAKEGIQHAGYTCLCYHANHTGTPHLGVFSDC